MMNCKLYLLVFFIFEVAVAMIILTLRFNIHQKIYKTIVENPLMKTFDKEIHAQSCPPQPCPTALPYIETKKEIANKLSDIYVQLRHAASHSKPPTPKILVELTGIISDLDPAHKLSNSEKEPTDVNHTNSSTLLDVCPEKYMGEKFDYPFYHKGWQLQDCKNVKPLNQVVSIILNTIDYPVTMEKQVETVLKGINQTYPQVKVFLAAKTSQLEQVAKNFPNVKTLAIKNNSHLGTVWNLLIKGISTPYTLVARDVVHFTWVSRIERQIRMISTTENVAIVGGSFRNLTGHWRVGCRQTKLFNYVLQYEEGYHYSRHSCMFCDDLEGPFVARTNLLKNLKFSEKYSKEILFEEFFLRVFQSGNLIMNCPDAMYFTTDYSSESKHSNKEIWFPLAKDLKLVRVVLLDYGIRHKFSCGDILYKCNAVQITKYAALPMCCLEQFGNAMKFFHDMSVKNNFHYELDSGSVLASLKFNNYSPFDIDGDLFLSSFNISFFNSQAGLVSQRGYKLGGYQKPSIGSDGKLTKGGSMGYIGLYTPDIHVEMWGYPYLSADQFSPQELNKPSHYTKCQVNNHWMYCNHFPALFSRNRYGPDVLKHSQSWRMHDGKTSSFQRYSSGSFVKCNDPTFHACLDKFPTDGNIAFKVL